MNDNNPLRDEPRLRFLAHYEAAVAAGEAPPTIPPPPAENERARLEQAVAVIDLLHRCDAVRVCPSFPPQVGRYRITHELGRGGMDIVYAAWDPDLNRPVAVKVLQDAGSEQQARLLNEAGSMARLAHPNIVRIFEIVRHENQPYLAVELIDGKSFALQPGAAPVTPVDAAKVIAQVASAIQHAHDHGIIHRDLKPSNILRTAEGEPKVTDFGPAKRMDRSLEITRTNAALGTPSYMAPEQTGGRGLITPAVDVYGLGATLYALLAGRPPFVGLTPFDILQQVQEEEPLSLRRLNPGVPEDLDTICRKCLEKDPARRYAAADALARDLERFLAGRPVLARPVSSLDRALRWCRRNPVLAGLVAGLFVVLVVGITTTSLLAAWALGERNQAQLDRTRAIESQLEASDQAEIASAVRDFLQNDLLLQASPGRQAQRGFKPEGDLTVRQALDRAAPLIPKRFSHRPRIEAALEHTVGAAYTDIGHPDRGIPHFRRALELLQTHLGTDHPERIPPLQSFRLAQQMNAVSVQEQLPTHRELHTLLSKYRGELSPETIQVAHQLGGLEIASGDRARGLLLLQSLVPQAKKCLGELAPETLHLQFTLALDHVHGKAPRAGPEALNDLLAISPEQQPRLFDPENRFLIELIPEMFLQVHRLDRFLVFTEATRAELHRRPTPDPHLLDLLTSQARLLQLYGHCKEAIPMPEDVRREWITREGPVAGILIVRPLDAQLLECRILADSNTNLDAESRALVEATSGKDVPVSESGTALVLRGWCLFRQKEFTEAEVCLRLGWEMIPGGGPTPNLRGWGQSLLGQVLLVQGKREEAEKHLTQAEAQLSGTRLPQLANRYLTLNRQVLQTLRQANSNRNLPGKP